MLYHCLRSRCLRLTFFFGMSFFLLHIFRLKRNEIFFDDITLCNYPFELKLRTCSQVLLSRRAVAFCHKWCKFNGRRSAFCMCALFYEVLNFICLSPFLSPFRTHSKPTSRFLKKWSLRKQTSNLIKTKTKFRWLRNRLEWFVQERKERQSGRQES